MCCELVQGVRYVGEGCGLGFGVWASGVGISGLWFGVWSKGFEIQIGFRVCGVWVRVLGLGFGVWGSGVGMSSLGFGVWS